MRIRLLLTLAWSVCLFALALLFITHNYRWFILPFAVMTMASVLLSAIAVAVNKDRLSRLALWFHGLLVLPWMFGFQWKGGDDGPGVAWFFFVGIGCAVGAALAFVGSDIAAPVTCVQCGAITPRGRFAAWQVLVSICFFPLGLLSLFLGRKATTCRNCGHCWQT
jgi:hypothetical protein